MQPKVTARFENDGRGMVFIGQGVISGEQLIQQTEKTYSPDVLGRLCYQIIDLRGVERMDITAEQMKHLATLDCKAAEVMSGAKIAIIASHGLTVGISRIYSAYAQSPKLEAQIFPTIEKARAWIDSTPGAGNCDGTSEEA